MRVDYTKYPGAAKVAKYHIAILGPGQCYRMSKKSCPTCKRFSRVPDTVNAKENSTYSVMGNQHILTTVTLQKLKPSIFLNKDPL